VAEIDSDGCCSLSADSGFSPGRDVRIDQSDKAGSCFNSQQHRGRTRPAGYDEYRQFLGVARGSNFELQTQLEIARALGTGDSGLLDEAEALSHEVGKMIFGVLKAINDKGSVH
jgi:four helix bundle protein